MINILKRLVLPVKVLCAFIISTIISILIYCTVLLPGCFLAGIGIVEFILNYIMPIIALTIGYYTTFRWLFYDPLLKRWSLQ
jgi:hypothetical protein